LTTLYLVGAKNTDKYVRNLKYSVSPHGLSVATRQHEEDHGVAYANSLHMIEEEDLGEGGILL
jgi:hypothetical protein